MSSSVSRQPVAAAASTCAPFRALAAAISAPTPGVSGNFSTDAKNHETHITIGCRCLDGGLRKSAREDECTDAQSAWPTAWRSRQEMGNARRAADRCRKKTGDLQD